MIVKNEERNLPTCLRSVVDLVDEIVIADTGSTDRSKEIAARFGACVVDFPWVDSFAAARNESLRHCTGDWVLWLDADEFFDEENRHKLRALLDSLGRENASYIMKQHAAPPGQKTTGTVVEQARLFPNHPQVRWEYRIHEQILPALGRLRAAQHFTGISITHTGYEDPALVKSKIERNLRLILMENEEHPDDPFTLFNLGWAYMALNRAAEALPVLQRSLERAPAGASIIHKLYALLANTHSQLRQPELALAACRAGLARSPDDAELLFLYGALLEERGDLVGAERCFGQLVPEGAGPASTAGGGASFAVGSALGASVFGTPTFGSLELGMRGLHARHHLANIYQKLGRQAEAERQWQALLAEDANHVPAWLQLGELYLGQQRWPELEQVLARLQALPVALDGAVFQARVLLARQEWAAARRLLEEIIGRAPRAVLPRVLLSRLLVYEGQDLPAAEQALRAVLALDPGQVESWRHLVALLRQRQQVIDAVQACGTARMHHPRDVELLLMEGHLCLDLGQAADAERRFLAVLEMLPEAPGEGRVGQQRHAAREQLALLYQRLRRLAEAEVQWRALLREEPHDAASWQRLGELWLAQGR
jgi:tetratricopeptide (TPR) repeat protein